MTSVDPAPTCFYTIGVVSVSPSAGGGHITVDSAALEALAQKVLAEAQEGKATASEATNKAQPSTGNGELDASLGGFTRTWGGLMGELNQGTEELSRAIDAAAANYRHVEATNTSRFGDSGSEGGTA